MENRQYDVVVWGASGFTGQLVVEYLLRQYPPGGELRWAIGGRNKEKLQELLQKWCPNDAQPDLVIADSHDLDSMNCLARSAKVVLTTVGPYARYGSELVKACVENGTDYCDLCGEVQWMQKMIDRYQAAAAQSGARIVMSCGFDSIPSDIGVWSLQQHALSRHGAFCEQMTLLVRKLKGGPSGGTIASMLNAIKEALRDKNVARILQDPYALNPQQKRSGPDGRDQSNARYNDDAQVWTAPFIMAGVNTRVVRRTNALLDNAYGNTFRYQEATIVGPGIGGRIRAMLMSIGLRLFLIASAIPFTRRMIIEKRLPKPGEGPTRQQQEDGYFDLLLIGQLRDEQRLRMRIKGDRDPGYGSTSKMLAESAVCLALDNLDIDGGIWTPASAMGGAILRRLVDNAGLSFDLE